MYPQHMSPTPEVQPLPYKQRRFVFIASLIIFFVTVPLLVFYAIGYRFDFTDHTNNIKSVGGMYVTAEVRDIEMYIDDEPVTDMRIFQSAAYIQNLEEGMHQIHTQGAEVQTWVKELPVFPHFVTEIQSFNMPKIPQVRLVTEFKAEEGTPVVFASSSPFMFASTSLPVFATTSSATTTYTQNAEYAYVESLFASSTEIQLQLKVQQERFVFTDRSVTSTALATTTKAYRQTKLFEEDNQVYMQWLGSDSAIPYYYCIRYFDSASSSIVSLYGEQVGSALPAQLATVPPTQTQTVEESTCRSTIRIDGGETIVWFDYLPGSRDFVLIQLSDGLYVIEVDDRAWQNKQQIYPGNNLEVLVDGSKIFIKDAQQYLEVFTEIQS